MKGVWFIREPANHRGWELWIWPVGVSWRDGEFGVSWNWGWWRI